MDSKVRWKWHTKESLKLSTNQQNLPSWKSGKKSKPKKKAKRNQRLRILGDSKKRFKIYHQSPRMTREKT